MLNDNFEKNIKSQLESAHLDWDKDAMWDDIEAQLPRKKRRVLPIVILSSLFILFLVFVKLFTFDTSRNEQPDNQENRQVLAADLNNYNRINDLIQPADSGLLFYVSDNQRFTKESLVSSESAENKVKFNSPSPYLASQSQFLAHSTTGTDIIISDKSLQIPTHLPYKRVETVDKSLRQTNSVVYEMPIDLLPPRAQKVVFRLPKLTFGEEFSQFMPSIEPALSKWKPDFRIGGMASVGFVRRSFEPTETNELFNLRKEGERPLESLASFIMMDYFINNSLFVRTGMEYRKVNESLMYNEIIEEQYTTQVDSAGYYTDFMGNVQYVSEERLVTKRSERNHRLFNSMTVINVPVGVGYRIHDSRWNIEANATLNFNILRQYDGAMILHDGNINLDFNERIDHSLIESMDFGLTLNYALSSTLTMSTTFNHRLPLSEFALDGFNRQSYSISEIRLGLFYNL